MKLNIFKNKGKMFVGAIAFIVSAGCSSDDSSPSPDPIINPTENKDFQLAFASGSGSISGTYMQGVADVDKGTISFQTAGTLISTGRTSRIFPSADGKFIYSLTYRQGTVDKWQYNGGSNYSQLKTIDASVPLGSEGLRFYKLNEDVGSLHDVISEPQYAKDGTTYLGHTITVTVGILDFMTMELKPGYKSDINVVMPSSLQQEGYHIWRIDCPVLSNGKLYYGAAVNKFNSTTGKDEETDKTMTLVMDYPSLTNATVIETTLAIGATNGYRTPTQQVNEQGEVYQMVSGGDQTSILKMVNGQYTKYKYSLNELLGKPTKSNGFFYAGNGIAYIPYEKLELPKIQIGVNPKGEPTYSSPWGLARMDLKKNTVVDLNVPDGLWLTQWQTSTVRNGKFYIALSPVGAAGHIYIFDVNSTNPEGIKGASTVSGADQYFIGIY